MEKADITRQAIRQLRILSTKALSHGTDRPKCSSWYSGKAARRRNLFFTPHVIAPIAKGNMFPCGSSFTAHRVSKKKSPFENGKVFTLPKSFLQKVSSNTVTHSEANANKYDDQKSRSFSSHVEAIEDSAAIFMNLYFISHLGM